MKGDRAAVRALLQQKADVNAPQADGATAIQWAAYRERSGDGGPADRGGRERQAGQSRGRHAAVSGVASHGSAPMIDKLLKAGADPNERGPEGETPLMLAARTGNLDAIKVLLDHKADVNAKDKLRGTTALMWAAEQVASRGGEVADRAWRGRVGARPTSTPGTRETYLAPIRLRSACIRASSRHERPGTTEPARRGRCEQVAALDAEQRRRLAQRAAASRRQPQRCKPTTISRLLRRQPDKDGGGLTPLVYAAREDCIECAKILVEAGADVNQTHPLRLDRRC